MYSLYFAFVSVATLDIDIMSRLPPIEKFSLAVRKNSKLLPRAASRASLLHHRGLILFYLLTAFT